MICSIVVLMDKFGFVYFISNFPHFSRLFGFTQEVRKSILKINHLLVMSEKEKIHVFDKDGSYFFTKKIAQITPKKNRYGLTTKSDGIIRETMFLKY